MAAIEAKKNKSKTTLTLSGSAGVENIAELKNDLEKHLSKSELLELDLGGVNSADVSFLQLLESLCKTAKDAGKRAVILRDSPIIKQLWTETGFFRQKHCVFFPEKQCDIHSNSASEA